MEARNVKVTWAVQSEREDLLDVLGAGAGVHVEPWPMLPIMYQVAVQLLKSRVSTSLRRLFASGPRSMSEIGIFRHDPPQPH